MNAEVIKKTHWLLWGIFFQKLQANATFWKKM